MQDVKEDPSLAYAIREQNTRFEVCSTSGRTILVCDDEDSASHYATLLNEAYRAGYKLGYRDGRNK